MKKRILALALAGTTAFSVFGAAMSANAAFEVVWDGGKSTHSYSQDGDYYRSYTPAENLYWSTKTTKTQLSNSENFGYVSSNVKLAETTDGTEYIPTKTTIYMWDTTTFDGNDDLYTLKSLDDLKDGRQTSVTDFIEDVMEYGHEKTEADGTITIDNDEYVVARVAGSSNEFDAKATFVAIPKDKDGNYVIPEGFAQVNFANGDVYYNPADFAGGVTSAQTVYMPTSSDATGNAITLNTAVTELIAGYAEDHDMEYFITDSTLYPTKDAVTLTNLKSVWAKAVDSEAYTDRGVYNVHDYDVLNPTVSDFDAIMDEEVRNGVVYLYDYYYDNSYPASVDADEFADGWADGTLADTLDATTTDKDGKGVIYPESGYSYRSVRGEVLDAWEDFLDNLGIADPNMEDDELTMWAEDTYDNYLYTYWDANVVTEVKYDKTTGAWEVTIQNGRNVDIYNFGDLIEDILDLAPAKNPDMDKTQTSELVYLMQQYEKYTDGFVDIVPVDTDDWGDLLVALAEAPTSDEFSTSNNYKRYTNRVEDLVEEYEEADTNAAVKLAEQHLYDFVTDEAADYKSSSKADKATLATSIDNTFVNYDWRYGFDDVIGNPAERVTGSAEVYAGALDTDGVIDMEENFVDETYGKAWALYPKADYAGTVTGANPGVDEKIYNVTSEYYWFYNVYDLAFNVYSGNTHQSTLDLMASTLDEAVDALVPASVSAARASDVLGAEEANDKIESLIETDYDDAIWADRTKINAYINDRVSNDEIGRTATNNAEDIATVLAKYMGWQKYQTSVTRVEINNLKTSKTNAETALEALRNDEENYNAAQANALQKAIDDCNYIIDIYDGDYATYGTSQTVNSKYSGAVADKDQILKSDVADAIQAVEDAINFKNIIQGWSQDEDKNWMYGTEEGYLNDGWHQVDGGKTWFYFNEDGTAKQSEWWQDPATGTWYWFNSNCGAAVGWAKIDGDWYYFKGNNAMKTGWEKVEGSWYYMNSSGKMVTGWCQINGTWYYFSKESNALGQMLANTTTPDGYKVDANGALVE